MTYQRILWRELLAYQAEGWRLAGAQVSQHSWYGPLMVKA